MCLHSYLVTQSALESIGNSMSASASGAGGAAGATGTGAAGKQATGTAAASGASNSTGGNSTADGGAMGIRIPSITSYKEMAGMGALAVGIYAGMSML